MKLEQLRAELDTDARKRCEAQEKTITDLIAKNKASEAALAERTAQNEQLSEICWQLTNRCKATGGGSVCMFCGIRSLCIAMEAKYGRKLTAQKT